VHQKTDYQLLTVKKQFHCLMLVFIYMYKLRVSNCAVVVSQTPQGLTNIWPGRPDKLKIIQASVLFLEKACPSRST